MSIMTKDTIEDIRNRLIQTCPKEPQEQRSGYINGILDFYNAMKIKEVGDERDKTAK